MCKLNIGGVVFVVKFIFVVICLVNVFVCFGEVFVFMIFNIVVISFVNMFVIFSMIRIVC